MTYAEKFPNWVPNSTMDTRQDTATLLVGTASEHGMIVRHHVASTQGGFFITDALADVVFVDEDEDSGSESDGEVSGNGDTTEPEVETATDTTPKTSGRKAAKTTPPQEGE